MAVTCPACGGESHDLEFCDHCNADLLPPPAQQAPGWCPLFDDYAEPLSPDQVQALARPEASLLLSARDQTWRVRWLANADWDKWQPMVEERLRTQLPVLPPCRLVEEDNGRWLITRSSGKPMEPWSGHVAHDPIEDLRRLCTFLDRLAPALEDLHAQHLTWLTFDPQEIEEAVNGSADAGALWFTNMDLAVYPARHSPEKLQVRPAYAAPEVARFRAADLGPASDVFHLAMFAYYWLAGFLPMGFPGSGLESFGHALPPLRTYAPGIPPGLSGVLARGLALEPRQRYPSPGAFTAALHKVQQRAQQRWSAKEPVVWEVGHHSRTGRAKSAANRDNEDHVLVRAFANPERALLAIADGITTCDVGSGQLASWITCLILENALDGQTSQDTFAPKITDVCRRAAESLLAWALEKGYRAQLAEGRDLMGSTLLAAWLEGNLMSLANVGDSRAYLIDGASIEQLTTDGDLGTELLASGSPPEEVKALGGMARGLRDCVGGCSVSPEGELTILEDYCQPALSRWPLLPGDVVVLCSDGLVEEGAFLEPEKLGEIVRSHPHLSATALAQQLAQAADALQRLPSPLEPEGFGDNITCVIIKVRSP
jgi:protein phosphatase